MNIPSCYFPTEIMFLDDNLRFLENMSVALGNDVVIKLFTNPQELINYLNNKSPDAFTKRCLHRPEEMEIDHRIIDVFDGKSRVSTLLFR